LPGVKDAETVAGRASGEFLCKDTPVMHNKHRACRPHRDRFKNPTPCFFEKHDKTA